MTDVSPELPTGRWTHEAVSAVAVGSALLLGLLCFMKTASRSLDAYAVPKEVFLHLAAAIATIASARRQTGEIGAVVWLLMSSLIVGIVSGLLAARNGWWALRALGINASTLLLYCSARQIVSARAREIAFNAGVVALAATAALVLLEAHGVLDGLSMPGRAPAGPGGNRNFTAHLLVLGLPLLVARTLLVSRRSLRILSALALSLALAAILLSRSRGAWLGGIAALPVMALAGARCFAGASRQSLALLAAGSLAGVLLAAIPSRVGPASGASDRASSLRTLARIGEFQEGTGRGRLVQYRTTLAVVRAQPWFGVGPGNWSTGYVLQARPPDPSYQPGAPQPVNRLPNSDLLGILSERGLLGTLPLLAAVAVLLAVSVRRLWIPRVGGDRALAWLALSMLVALLVMGSVDAVILRVEPAVLVAVTLGLCRLDGGRPLTITGGRRMAITVMAAVTGLTLAFRSAATARSLLLADRGRAAMLERAYDLDPGNFVLAGRAALKYAVSGDCQRAGRLARAAQRYFPEAPEAEAALTECRRRDWIEPARPGLGR